MNFFEQHFIIKAIIEMEEQKIIAEAGKRLGAYLIDILPVIGIVTAIFYFFLDFDLILDTYFANKSSLDARIDFLRQRNYIRNLSLFCYIAYCTIMECSSHQGTFGKQLFRIQVVNRDGQQLSFSESLKRNFSKLVSTFILGLGFIWILFSKKKQGWHDLIADTFVIDKPRYTPVIISSRPVRH